MDTQNFGGIARINPIHSDDDVRKSEEKEHPLVSSSPSDPSKLLPCYEHVIITCPANLKPGDPLNVVYGGRKFALVIPPGALPGQPFAIRLARATAPVLAKPVLAKPVLAKHKPPRPPPPRSLPLPLRYNVV